MDNCIFCRIAKGEIPCEKIWEDRDFLAFLDIHPTTEGMTLIIPKQHLSSNVFHNEDRDVHNLISAAKKVSILLEKNLIIERVFALFEGIEINYLHLKLYPLRKGESLKMVLDAEGCTPTHEELHKLALKITK